MGKFRLDHNEACCDQRLCNQRDFPGDESGEVAQRLPFIFFIFSFRRENEELAAQNRLTSSISGLELGN